MDTSRLVLFQKYDEYSHLFISEHTQGCSTIDLGATKMSEVRKALARHTDTLLRASRVLLVGDKAQQVLLGDKYENVSRSNAALLHQGESLYIPTFDTVTPMNKMAVRKAIELFLSDVDVLPIEDKYVVGCALPPVPGGTRYTYLDIETTGLDYFKDNLISLQLAFDDGICYYVQSPPPELLRALYQALFQSGVTLVAHNALFDLSFLTVQSGKDWFSLPVDDTMLLAKARGLSIVNLKYLAGMFSSYHPLSYSEYRGAYNKDYAVVDILAMRDVHKRMLQKGYRPIDSLSSRAMCLFGRTRLRGFKLNEQLLLEQQAALQERASILEAELQAIAAIKWSSNAALVEFLVREGVKLVKSTPKGGVSVDKEALEAVKDAHPVIPKVLELRDIQKLLSTFYDPYAMEGGTIHATVNVLGAETGRTSCSNPNLQQVPLEVRKVFISSFTGGKIGAFDLDRSELVCAVLLSGDTTMAKALLEYDYHTYVASIAFQLPYESVPKEKRSIAKMITFGALLYGGSARGIAQKSGSQESIIASAVQNLRGGFKKLAAFQDRRVEEAYEKMWLQDTYGKIRDLKPVKFYGYGDGMGNVKRVAMNNDIQGLSAYICLHLCLFVDEFLENYQSSVILQVHDEVVLDIHPDELDVVQEAVKEAFRRLGDIDTLTSLPGWSLIQPSGELKIGDSWYETK